jgi:hypothetical protein
VPSASTAASAATTSTIAPSASFLLSNVPLLAPFCRGEGRI